MAIELLEEIVNRCDKIGDDNFELSPGKRLSIKAGLPLDQKDILKVTVPAGKRWLVHVAVVIQEVDE